MKYIHRNLSGKLEKAVKTFSAVYLGGARQCGKSTFIKNTLLPDKSANYLTFDLETLLLSARQDPDAFIAGLPKDKLNIIDEVQRVKNIYLRIKKAVDDQRLEGKGKGLFLLTGSSNIFALPELAEHMVGRIALLTLYPFSAAETHNSARNFIDALWNKKLTVKNFKRADVIDLITQSTFPELVLDRNIDRSLWFNSYLTTILRRDAFEFAMIRKPDMISRLLVSLSGRVGSLLRDDNIMKETGMNQGTYTKYKAFCHAAFMTFEVQPWAKPNKLNKRFMKSKKVYFTDTNFLCFLLRRDIRDVFDNNLPLKGALFENFVASEIMKSISVLPGTYYVSHFNPVRGDGNETDFVIEKDNGEAIAIEVKSDSTLSNEDFRNLALCRDTIGNKFKLGIVLYPGNDLVPFGERLWAVPVNYLWTDTN